MKKIVTFVLFVGLFGVPTLNALSSAAHHNPPLSTLQDGPSGPNGPCNPLTQTCTGNGN